MTPGIRALVLSGSCFVVAAAGLVLRAQEKPANSPDPPVSFNREILPILSNNCFACHGPDEKARKTRFHFDTQDGAFIEEGRDRPGQRGGEPAGPAHHQRRPGRAHAAARVRAQRSPRSRSTCCAAGSIEGAKWDTHWAYVPPKRPEPPGDRAARSGCGIRSISSSSRGSSAKASSRRPKPTRRPCSGASPTT